MREWKIKKNRIDMDYQQTLQKYQVLLASKWAIPLAILGLFFQMGIAPNDAFFWGGMISFVVYSELDNRTEKTTKKLSNLKGKVTKLEKK